MKDGVTDKSKTVRLFLTCISRKPARSREKLTKEEYYRLVAQRITELPADFFVIKMPNHQALFCQAPVWPHAVVSAQQRAAYEQYKRAGLCEGAQHEKES